MVALGHETATIPSAYRHESEPELKKVIHQYHACARPFDAVTSHMISIQAWLKEIGIGGEIFAHDRKGAELVVNDPCTHDFLPTEVLLIHHSQGNPQLESVLKLPCKKSLVYHNITPAKYFGHDAFMAKMANLGRQQLRQYQGKVQAVYADSQFNAFEIEDHGLGPVHLLPLLDLTSAEGPALFRKPATTTKRLLFVGRITPHKAQAELVKILFYLREDSALDFRLTLVGSEDPLYGRYVRSLVKALGLSSAVEFRTKVEQIELEKVYLQSDAFICLSQHEGFGIPLVEAIRFGVPVFALRKTAVTETMGGAGVGLLTKKPHRVSEIIRQALLDDKVITAILESQAERWLQLRRFQCRKNGQKILSRLLGKTATSGGSNAMGLPLSSPTLR